MRMSKIAIRVDTNKKIATGHVMRCMAVATQLIKMGADVYVISADDGVLSFVKKAGEQSDEILAADSATCTNKGGDAKSGPKGSEVIYSHIMNTNWSDMESELSKLIEYLRAEGINSLLVDSYQVTESYFERLREAGIHVVYMDDLCARAYSVDALINYNICAPHMGYGEMYKAGAKADHEPGAEDTFEKEASDKETSDTEASNKGASDIDASDKNAASADGVGVKLYLGPRYAPLRSQFASPTNENRNSLLQNDSDDVLSGETRLREKNAEDRLEDVLGIFLTTGGSDSLGIAETIIRAIPENAPAMENPVASEDGYGNNRNNIDNINNKNNRSIPIHLLAGRYYDPSPYVMDEVKSGRVVLHQNVDNVAEVMSTCKLAVSSAGSTLYELCAMGIPAISFTFADNQIENALGFDREGVIPYAGDFRTDREGCIRKILDFLEEYVPVVRDCDTPGEIKIETGDTDARTGYPDKEVKPGFQKKDVKSGSAKNEIQNNYLDIKHRMQSVTDGHGAERIAHIMTGLDRP